jgi:hypothetical protein
LHVIRDLRNWSLPSLMTGRWGFALVIVAFAEVAFHLYYLRTKAQIQELRSQPHRARTPKARRAFVEQCIEALRPPGQNTATKTPSPRVRAVFEAWFHGTALEDISRGAMLEWCTWAFFSAELASLTHEEQLELEDLLAWFESEIGHTFPEKTDHASSIRLSLDPILDSSRPLFYYAAIFLMDCVGQIGIRALGFSMHTRSTAKQGGGPTFYVRRARNRAIDALPIVFIPGIGIGFVQYLALIAKLPRNVDVYLVETPWVSMQICPDVPSVDATTTAMRSILMADGHPQACFVGHSLGSTAVAWAIHADADAAQAAAEEPTSGADAQANALPMVGGVVLLDPVTFLLYDSGVATNFLHRTPTSIIELLMHFFVSRELFIAHTLSRNFSWSHNTLFVGDLDTAAIRARACVVLSGGDSIVPTAAVRTYLDGHGDSKRLDVVFFEEQQHGEMLVRAHPLKEVAQRINAACRLEQ